MKLHETHDKRGEIHEMSLPDSTAGSSEGLESLRESGERLLAIGDDAISRALSGNSEAFLLAARQSGGE